MVRPSSAEVFLRQGGRPPIRLRGSGFHRMDAVNQPVATGACHLPWATGRGDVSMSLQRRHASRRAAAPSSVEIWTVRLDPPPSAPLGQRWDSPAPNRSAFAEPDPVARASPTPPSGRWTRVLISVLLTVLLGSLGVSAFVLSDQRPRARAPVAMTAIVSPAAPTPPAVSSPTTETAAPAPPISEPAATPAPPHHSRGHAVRSGSARHRPPRQLSPIGGQALRHYPWGPVT
jgi:hypothetical protein